MPFVYMVDVSLRLPQDSFDPSILVGRATLANFSAVLKGTPIGHYFVNSIVISAVTVACVVAAASAFTFAVSILRVRYSLAMYGLILVTLTIPIAALVIPLSVLLHNMGLLNNDLGLIGPYSALGVPFAVVIMRGFMDTLPQEVLEAAVVDGASTWRVFTRVVLPMLKPSLVFIATWQLITSWNEFFLALVVMTNSAHFTLPLVPEEYSGVYLATPGPLFAILVLIAVPLIVVYIVVQRWFVAGIMSGAVKS
jgi:ABC-type glycerol-3-phosphate transport system permease component